MIATRLSAVWQVAGVAAAALCCYLVSQSVAAERAGLGKIDRRIGQAHDEIARLETELGARGRMDQLESWNMQALGLKAPRPAQFVADGTQLVALYARNGRPALQLDPDVVATQGDTTTVAYHPAPAATARVVPTAMPRPAAEPAETVPAEPLLRTATFVRPKPQRLAPEAPIIHVAFHPAATSLLPADIADIAAAERGKGLRAKADR